jgi:hypothetical protein
VLQKMTCIVSHKYYSCNRCLFPTIFHFHIVIFYVTSVDKQYLYSELLNFETQRRRNEEIRGSDFPTVFERTSGILRIQMHLPPVCMLIYIMIQHTKIRKEYQKKDIYRAVAVARNSRHGTHYSE